MVELRVPGHQHWYNPNRDLASQTVQIIRQACEKMTDEFITRNHAVSGIIKDFGITNEHMGRVAQCLANFVLLASEETEGNSLQEVLGRSGLLDLPQPPLMVAFALIAQGLLGRFHGLVRKSSKPDLIVPVHSKEGLVDEADLMQRIFRDKTFMDKANMAKDMKRCADLPALPPS